MTLPTDLWLVRHGTSEHHLSERLQWEGVPLSEEGQCQAALLARRFRTLEAVVALYSSPLRRAWDTAVPIAAALGLPPIARADLREMEFGEAGGLTIEEFRERWPCLAQQHSDPNDPAFRWPGGESRGGFARRAATVMASLVATHPGQRIVVVAHTGVIGCYLANLFLGNGILWREFVVQPASVSRLQVGLDGAHLLLRDDVSHLELGQAMEIGGGYV